MRIKLVLSDGWLAVSKDDFTKEHKDFYEEFGQKSEDSKLLFQQLLGRIDFLNQTSNYVHIAESLRNKRLYGVMSSDITEAELPNGKVIKF